MESSARPIEVDSGITPCRDITEEEVAHYKEHGWVMLRGFASPQTVSDLLGIAKRRMGEEGDANDTNYGVTTQYFNPEYGGGLTDPAMRGYMEKACEAAKKLLDRRTGTGLRYMTDFFAPKLPASRDVKNKKAAGNGPTAFHQDWVSFAVDRTGGMSIWTALGDYDGNAGTMSFYSGSYKLGVLGNYTNYDGREIYDVYPELAELGMTEPQVYKAGDVTVHNHLTVHGAGINLTDKPRWAYVMVVHPADAHWNGAASEGCDTTGMLQNDPFPDDRFPVLA